VSDTEDNSDRSEELRRFYDNELAREAHRRRFLYADVETLLTQGFLPHTVVVRGVPITFRSLTDDAVARLRQRLHRKITILEWRRLMLAASTHAVGHLVVPLGDTNAEYALYRDLYSVLPLPYTMSLSSVLDGFSRRVARAISLVEAYCYEPYSRTMWRGMVGLNTPVHNAVYRVWRSFNLAEDERMSDFMQWEHTRMVVSSMSSKGAKHLLNEEKKIKQQEQNRRNGVIEQTVTRILSGSQAAEESVVTVTLDGETFEVPRIMSAHTADELMTEMERAAKGEKDYHDKVVERYKDGVRARVESERNRRQEAFDTAMTIAREEQQAKGVADEAPPAPLVGYTPEQLRELNLTSTFTPRRQSADSSHGARLYDRYMQTSAPKVGWVGVKGIPEPASPPSSTGAGDGEPAPSPLQQAVAARKPTLKP
jgi:hypothetical protein